MRRPMLLVVSALCLSALVGCGSQQTPESEGKKPEAAQPKASPDALKLEGPGGTVTLGDEIAVAQKAFPAPEGAQVLPNSMSFRLITEDGWSWTTDHTSFEAATKDGKVIGLAVTFARPEDAKNEPAATITKIGEPTKKADGKTAKLYVWDGGESVRFWGNAGGGPNGFEIGGLTVIGNKEDLKKLNYDAEHPEAFVNQLDSMAHALKPLDNMGSGRMRQRQMQQEGGGAR